MKNDFELKNAYSLKRSCIVSTSSITLSWEFFRVKISEGHFNVCLNAPYQSIFLFFFLIFRMLVGTSAEGRYVFLRTLSFSITVDCIFDSFRFYSSPSFHVRYIFVHSFPSFIMLHIVVILKHVQRFDFYFLWVCYSNKFSCLFYVRLIAPFPKLAIIFLRIQSVSFETTIVPPNVIFNFFVLREQIFQEYWQRGDS